MQTKRRRVLTFVTVGSFSLLVCILVASSALVLLGRTHANAAEPPKHQIVYGLTVMPSGFDPHIYPEAELGIVLRSVYDTLLYRNPKTRDFVPGLASKTEVSADGLTYTFKLRADVTFHDGTSFDAHAVARTLERITNPDTHSQKALALLGPYDHYTVIDPQTIQIVLKQPYAPLLDGLCQVYLGIASPAALDAYDNDRYQFHQIGTGPFRMVDYIPGDHLTLRRNPDYKWGPAFYTATTDRSVDEIVFRFFKDAPTRAPALEVGDTSVIGELSPTDATLFTGNNDLRLYPQAIPGMPLQFFFNTAKAPTDRLEVRQALLDATNRAAIVDAIFQQFSPIAYGPLSASTPYYDKSVQQMYPYDAGKAQQLLGALGYITGTDKMLAVKGEHLHLIVIVPPWGFHPEVGQKLQSQWRELGIEVELRQVANYAGLITAQKEGNYNLIAVNDFGVDASLLSHFYGSGSSPNWTNIQDQELDGWLSNASASVDAATRADLYAKVQRRIMEQALLLPIRDYVNLNGASARLNGLSFDAYGWFPLLANVSVAN